MDVSRSPSALVVVDVQCAFINEHTRHVPPLVERAQERYGSVFVTCHVNPPGSPHERFLGWRRCRPDSAEAGLAFEPVSGARVYEKSTYTAVTAGLLADLRALDIGRVFVCGLDTEACVTATAIDLFSAGIRPVVLVDLCASSGGPVYHYSGLRVLERTIGLSGLCRPSGQGS